MARQIARPGAGGHGPALPSGRGAPGNGHAGGCSSGFAAQGRAPLSCPPYPPHLRTSRVADCTGTSPPRLPRTRAPTRARTGGGGAAAAAGGRPPPATVGAGGRAWWIWGTPATTPHGPPPPLPERRALPPQKIKKENLARPAAAGNVQRPPDGRASGGHRDGVSMGSFHPIEINHRQPFSTSFRRSRVPRHGQLPFLSRECTLELGAPTVLLGQREQQDLRL